MEIPESLKRMIEFQEKISKNLPKNLPNFDHLKLNPFLNSDFSKSIQRISKSFENLENDPELQFYTISELEILSLNSSENLSKSLRNDIIENDIAKKEELLNKNLLPYLKKMNLDSLWIGANQVLNSNDNPDKLRQSLISIRTLLEYLIDEKLAPKTELINDERFKKEFKDYKSGKEKIEYVKIKRSKKIEYFSSKIKFGTLEELTKKDINLICDFYSTLCNIHQPNIGITENQTRILKIKTGITLWLLSYIYEVINN